MNTCKRRWNKPTRKAAAKRCYLRCAMLPKRRVWPRLPSGPASNAKACIALSPKGNPTLKTLVAVLDAAGLRLAITRRDEAHA